MSEEDKKEDEQPFDQLSKILRDNELTKTEFSNLAHDHPDSALTNEMSRSHVGGMSHFNCLYQMKLALISRLHSKLKSYKPPKIGNNESISNEEEEIKLTTEVTDALCDNFDLVNELIRTDPLASSQILEVLLDSIGRLDLNALSNEPTKPLNKLENILQSLLLEATNDSISSDILSLKDQQKVFATAVELALTRASAPRLLTIIETLLKCTQSNNKTNKSLLFPLPRTLLTLANMVRNTQLYPPNDKYIVDEYKIEISIDNNIKHVGSMVSNGKYLFIYGYFGLLKIGTGYFNTIKSKIYAKNDNFYNNNHGCLILLNQPKLILLFRSKAIEPNCFIEIDSNTLQPLEYINVDDNNEYFKNKSHDNEYYNGEWLKQYTPSFSNGKYLSILKKTIENEYEIIQFDPLNNYSYNKTIKLLGPIDIKKTKSIGGCYGCGGNMNSELGLGNTQRKDKPILLEWTKDLKCGLFKQIASGNQWHGYLTQSGDLYIAGHNSSGQLGLGNTTMVKTATLHKWYKTKGPIKMISSGTYGDHLVVLMENGDIYSHGSGCNSQLGINDDTAKFTPQKVLGLDGLKISYITADNRVSCFLTNSGEVYTCGYDDYGALGHGKNKKRIKIPEKIESLGGIKIISVVNSYTHMLLLDDKGCVYSCGQNSYGQLGYGNKTNDRDDPKKIEHFIGIKIKKIVVGYYHSACITDNNIIYMWGYASNYALGTDKSSHETLPIIPEFFKHEKIIDVACGGFHSIWLTNKNELYSCGSNSYGECMIGKTGTVRKPTLCDVLKDQTIISINAGLYTSIIQTENTEIGMNENVMDIATFMSGPNSIAFTVPNNIRLGVTDEKNLKYYDDQDGIKPEIDITNLHEPRMRLCSGFGNRMLHQTDIILPTNCIDILKKEKEDKKQGEPEKKENKKLTTINNKICCYEAMTNSIWIFDPKTNIIQQYFSLDSNDNNYNNITAKDIIASPATPDTILIHPSFAIPCTAGDLCEAKRVVVALIAQLDLMANKQTGDWKKFVIGQNEDTFHSMFGILDECWQFLKRMDTNNNNNNNNNKDSEQMLFYGVLLQSIFGLLQINIEYLPSKMFETEGVVLFVQENELIKDYFCTISLSLSRSIDAEIGTNIVIRCNDREIALKVEEFHDDDDEIVYISNEYGFKNLCVKCGDIVSIDSAVSSKSNKIMLRVITNDLKMLPKKFRDEIFIKRFYIEQYFKKDILITNQTVINIKPLRKNKIDFDNDDVIKNILKLDKNDNDLDTLINLRFKIESIEPNTAESNHFIVDANCEIIIDLKPKNELINDDEKKDIDLEKENDIYFIDSYRKISQKTMNKLCDLLEEIITYPNSSKYDSTFNAVYNRAKQLYKHGYRTFFTTAHSRCNHLYKWMNILISENNEYNNNGIERLLLTAIEILKETPQVSYLFYPKVAHEFGGSKAIIIPHDMLDEQEADAWLTKFVKDENVRIDFLNAWHSADVEGIGRINWIQLQRILSINDNNNKQLQEFKHEIGYNKQLDFYDYAKCALFIKHGIPVDRPKWARKKDLKATQRTFIPKISSKSLQTILSFIDGHTKSNIQYIIKTKQIPNQLNSPNPQLQTMALNLVVSVLNDLIRRSLAAGTENKPLDRFPPLSQFISIAFETTFTFLRKSREAQSILSPQLQLTKKQKENDAFTSFKKLDASMYKLIMNSNNLRVILPYLVTNLTVLISNGWSHIRELGQLALNLMSEMNGLTNILSLMDNNNQQENDEKKDSNEIEIEGLNSETSMIIESEHPYEGAKQRCYKCVLPSNVSFIVLEFDKQCQSAQVEDYCEIFSGSTMSIKLFKRYAQETWPSSALIIPGNCVRIEFNTVSDYNDVKRQDERWGFKVTVKGYITHQNIFPCQWIIDLEKQVGYLGALCASKLISSDGIATQTDSERKIAHVLRSKIFEKGIAAQYLHTEDGKLQFIPKSRYDRFLAKLVAEPEYKDEFGDDIDDEKYNNDNDNIHMATTGPHLLVDWMRRQRGGVEQLKSSAIGDGINSNNIDEKWTGWVTGFPRSFKVITCDEFGIGLDYGCARIKIEVIRGSAWGKQTISCSDFSGRLEFENITAKYACPLAVSQLAACRSNDSESIYIFGGYKSDNKESNKCYRFELDSSEWKECKQMPGTLRGAEAIPIGNNKIIVAGTYPTGDNIWIYDELNDNWENINKTEKTGWEAQIIMDNNNNLHIIGGLQGHDHHLRYNIDNKEWKKLNGLPEPRICGGLVCGPDGCLYLFGGTNSRENRNVSDKMYKYDDDNDEWIELKQSKLPKALVQFAYCNTGDQIIVFGGGDNYGNDVAPQYDNIYIYNFLSNEWIESEIKLPEKNREFVAVYVHGEIHLFGGSANSKKNDTHFIVRGQGGNDNDNIGKIIMRKIEGKSQKIPVDFNKAIITDFEDGSYQVETTINESGIFYLRVLVNDHPILGSPFKVHVESSFNDIIEYDNKNIYLDDYKMDKYYVENNLKEIWKNTKVAFEGRKLINIKVKPTDFECKYKDNICCTIFIPNNIWNNNFDINLDVTMCAIANENRNIYKAIKCVKIDDEFEEEIKKDEKEEEKTEIKKVIKKICYFSRDLEKYFNFGLNDNEWKPKPKPKPKPKVEKKEMDMNIQIGVKFKMGNINYIIESIDNNNIKCKQFGDNINNEFPQVIYLKDSQLKHVNIIIGKDNINIGMVFKMDNICYIIESIDNNNIIKCKQFGDNIDNEFPDIIYLQKTQLKHVNIISELDNINIGMEFKMGNICYIIESIDNNNNIKCKQCGDNINNEFPNIIYLQNTQLKHVNIINKKKEIKIEKKEEELKDNQEEEDEEDKPDPFATESFFLSISNNKTLPLPNINSLIYTIEEKGEANINTEIFGKYILSNKIPINNGETIMNKYNIIEIRDSNDLILPFGFINNDTIIKLDMLRSINNNNNNNNKFEIFDIMELEPILQKEQLEKKEELESIIEEKKKTLPEWYIQLRTIRPGLPMKLYAIAYREKEKNMEQALNWLLDKADEYVAKHIHEFEELMGANGQQNEWQCQFCTFINKGKTNCEMCLQPKPEDECPDYLDENHSFWKKKLKEKENNDEKKSDNDDNSNDEELNEILFGGIPFSGNDIFIIDKLPIKPFKLSLMLLPAPISYSPSANTIAARRAIRYVFASLLRHHGVISEAMTCVNFLETFGALQVSKTTHPLLNELAKLWDVALALKHELAEQYDYEIINKNENINNCKKDLTIGSKSEYDSIGNKLRIKIKKDFIKRSDDDIGRELIKFKLKILPNDRIEMENKLMKFRLDLAIRGRRCCCGSRMIRMIAREIYGSRSLNCDICSSSVRGTLLAYHCPYERSDAHPNGYDVCMDCLNKQWNIDNNNNNKVNINNNDPYKHLSQIVIDKMTLLFQLYPTNKDFGVSELGTRFKYDNNNNKQKQIHTAPLNKHQSDTHLFIPPSDIASSSQNDPRSAPVHPQILLRAVSAETKQDDHLFLSDTFPMDKLNRTKSENNNGIDMSSPFGMFQRAKSTPNVDGSGGGDSMDNLQPVYREDSLSRIKLSRVPDECESSEITQMIMYIVRKDISPRMIRNSLSERRLRAKQRIMGFRLFKSLFDNTLSNGLHRDFAWLLASSIRECIFKRIYDPKLGPNKIKSKRLQSDNDIKDEKKEEKNDNNDDDMDYEEWLQDEEDDSDLDEDEIRARQEARKKRIELRKKRREKDKLAQKKGAKQFELSPEIKWKRDIWDDDNNGNELSEIIHYLRGIEGCGPKLTNLTRIAFQKLYTKLTAIFRQDSNKELNMGALGFLESWSIHFNISDHSFLHDSQIFPVIRSLMSRREIDVNNDNNNDENNNNNNISVYSPTNLTLSADIRTSTAQHRVEYMIDESTETFWQSAVNADNDQFNYNRVHGTHWIQILFKKIELIKEIIITLDSDRDREYIPKTFQLYIGESETENELVNTINISQGFTGWFSIKMIDCKSKSKLYCVDTNGCISTKFIWLKIPSIHDGQYEMRIRQLIIYGNDIKQNIIPDSFNKKLQRVQDSALNLFRRLVSRTFLPTAIKAAQKAEKKAELNIIQEKEEKKEKKEEEKQIKNIDDGINSNSDDSEPETAPPKPGLLRQKTTEVQEEMVGILAFIGGARQDLPIGNLQRLVFELIFSEIKKEMRKSLNTNKIFYDLEDDDAYDDYDIDLAPNERYKLKLEKIKLCINDNYCFEMFCMILDLALGKSGQKFIASPLLVSTLFQIFARSSTRMQDVLISIFTNIFKFIKPNVIKYLSPNIIVGKNRKLNNLIDFYLYCIASSLKSQLYGTKENGKKYSSNLVFSNWINPFQKQQCKSIVKMLRNIIENNNSKWKQIIKQRLIDHILCTNTLKQNELSNDENDDEKDNNNISIKDRFWLIAASLCIIAGDTGSQHLDILNFNNSSEYNIDFREGNATIKVLLNNYPIIIFVADLTQCKSLITFKKIKTNKSICRFCDTNLNDQNRYEIEEYKDIETLKDVCNDTFCIDSAKNVCRKRLLCGHLCYGILNETKCLPCLESDCDCKIKEDRDTYCNICYTDTLSAQPTILLNSCLHAFHYKCCHRMLELRYNGPRITFGFRGCPLCKKIMRHEGLNELNKPLDKLFESVKAKSLMRLQYEKLDKHPNIINKSGIYYENPTGFAMNKYAYYMCYKCNEPYYGGEAACAAAQGAKNFDPSELLCPSCSPIRVEDCPKHGKDYIEFKCRYCCTIAVWFCFGTTHFCEACHNNNGRLTSSKKEDLVQCPCKPKDRHGLPEKLKDTKECPLKLKHPSHGEEYCLGCGLCRNKDF